MREELDLLQFDRQRDGVEEDINLEDEEEEEPEVFKHLRKEIPEEANVRGQVGHWKTGERKMPLNLNNMDELSKERGNISQWRWHSSFRNDWEQPQSNWDLTGC